MLRRNVDCLPECERVITQLRILFFSIYLFFFCACARDVCFTLVYAYLHELRYWRRVVVGEFISCIRTQINTYALQLVHHLNVAEQIALCLN